MKKILVAAAVTACFGTAGAAEDINVDIAVIGAGGAGLSAAVEATELGAKVVVVEKMAMVGGNTVRAAGGLNAAETALQKAKGTKDSVEIMFYDTMKGGHWLNDPALVRTLAQKSASSVEWLLAHGGDLRDVGLMAGATQPRTHRPTGGALVGPEVVRTLYTSAKNLNIDLRTNTQATEILTKDGAVVGIKVKGKDGVYTIHSKAVVDAAGGFGANNDLVAKYVPRLKGFDTTNHKGATGDGITLAEKIGAQLIQMEQIQTHPTVVPGVGDMITEAVRGNGAILINKEGKRFYNELETRDKVSAAILKQKDGIAYLFFDSDMQKSLKATNGYIKKSYCLTGATLDEIAGKMGVPAADLKASMDAWKAGKAAGKDAFGRADMPRDLDKGPFYAIAITPAVHHTMGGIKIDPLTQVYNVEGKVIPGFFAAGEITGGVHGGNRLGGNAQADIVTFGRIAGQQAYIYARGLDAQKK
ncbi:flavocytochrome c [Sutterella sp.]|uniref:flavocytochrome c n=1 Tax=Sutterella sp. TaxID=1981025 RepID=UPI0026DFC0B8|nr:flavocytochrome c [Sutterella sp.]MDO5530985.1 flavocytochrome c [Sutterella sp.]